MKHWLKKTVSLLIVFSVIFGCSTLVAASDRASVEQFVERCYTVVLGREADPDGKAFFTDSLLSGTVTGIDTAYSFFFSPEYKEMNKSDEDFISDLYWTFMNRAPEADGSSYWISCINNGISDKVVFNGFATSIEFVNICARYGIRAGNALPGNESCRGNLDVSEFVERMYTVILGRGSEREGMNYWVEQLQRGTATGIMCAQSFVFSSEYKSMNKSDADFIRDLYVAFFDREASDAEVSYWVQAVAAAPDDSTVFNGFATSSEFKNLCADYGIAAGSPITTAEFARNRSEIRTITINTSNGPVTVTGYYDYSAETEIYNQLNAYRMANGLNPLGRESGLNTSAYIRAVECSYSNSHTRPDGSRWSTAFPTIYGWRGENIAAGYMDASAVMEGWRNSPMHNSNMLKAEYTTVGIGVFVVTSGDACGYTRYYTQNFGG